MRRNLVCIFLVLFGALLVDSCHGAMAAQTPTTTSFQETFDKLAKEKDLTAAARFFLKNAGEGILTPMLYVLAGKPGEPERETVLSFTRGVADFATACGAEAFKPLFSDEGSIAPAETISLEEAVKRYEAALSGIENKPEEDAKFMKLFPTEGTQIIEFTILRKPESRIPGDIKLTMFFVKEKLVEQDVWRVKYAIASVARP